jgi:hypothetical protein
VALWPPVIVSGLSSTRRSLSDIVLPAYPRIGAAARSYGVSAGVGYPWPRPTPSATTRPRRHSRFIISQRSPGRSSIPPYPSARVDAEKIEPPTVGGRRPSNDAKVHGATRIEKKALTARSRRVASGMSVLA